MTPDFELIAASDNITNLIKDRFIELTLEDKDGIASDTLQLTLDNRDGKIRLPDSGVELQVRIGDTKNGLIDKGLFIVGGVGISRSSSASIKISGQATNFVSSLKSQKKRTWSETTLGAIVEKIAGEHGLKPSIASGFDTVIIDQLDQTCESDINLLTRIAARHNALFKCAGGALVFSERGTGEAPNGKTIAPISLNESDLTTYSFDFPQRNSYNSVQAFWQNLITVGEIAVTAGAGEPVKCLSEQFSSAEDASAAAAAELARLTRNTGKGRFTVDPGRADLQAGGAVIFEGMPDPRVDVEWIVKGVSLRLGTKLTTSAVVEFKG